MGFGLQQSYVADQDLAPLYGFEENENFRSEAGLTIGASYQIDLAENLTFGTNLNTFTNVGKALSSTDIHFNNKLVGRINSFMNATLNLDRKSTRLNSSHVAISYAVFCLKKKKKNTTTVLT